MLFQSFSPLLIVHSHPNVTTWACQRLPTFTRSLSWISRLFCCFTNIMYFDQRGESVTENARLTRVFITRGGESRRPESTRCFRRVCYEALIVKNTHSNSRRCSYGIVAICSFFGNHARYIRNNEKIF